MAFDLSPRDPLEPTQELADAPLAEVLTKLAEAVAEGQARLDLSAAQVVQELASSRVSIIQSIRQIIREDGTVEFEQASPVEVSLLDLGITPTFYAFSEATAEVAMDLKVTESATETGAAPEQRAFLSVATRSLRTERRLNRDVSVHSRVSVKLVPVPPPPRLEPTVTVEEQPEGGGVSSLALSASTVIGGTTPTPEGTVTLDSPAPAGGISVALSSADPNVVEVPSSVNVPAGSATAQFQVNTEPVSSSTPVAITASSQDVRQTATLTVQPPAPVGLSFSPQRIRGGETSTGTIALNGPAPSGTSVALTGSDATTADFPATVQIQADATRITFPATGKTFTGAGRSVDITASYLGQTHSAALTVLGGKRPPPPPP